MKLESAAWQRRYAGSGNLHKILPIQLTLPAKHSLPQLRKVG